MRIMRSTKSVTLGLAVIASLAARQAVAQVPSLAPSRVGDTMATRGTGGLVMAVRGKDGSLNYAERTGLSGAGWSKWDAWSRPPGGVIVTTPVVIMNGNGKILVLARGTDNNLYVRNENSPPAGSFDLWVQVSRTSSSGSTIPGLSARPALVRRGDGILAMYATDVNGTLWESTQTSVGGSSWNRWQSLGTPSGVALRDSPVLAMMNNGAFLAFSAGRNNHLYSRMQSSGSWGAWTDLGGTVAAGDAIAAALNSNGRVSTFINNTSGTISVRTQTTSNTNSWTAWGTLPGTVTGTSRPAVAVQNDGRIAVFFWSGNTRSVYWTVQTAASGTSWTNWVNLQSSTSGPVASISDTNGVIHFLVLDNSGYIYERAQASANSGSWIQWQAGYLGGPFAGL